MKRRHRPWILALLLLAVPACGPGSTGPSSATEADRAFEEAKEAFAGAETPEEEVAIVRDFLARFPASDYTAIVLGAAVDPFVELDRAGEAAELFRGVIEQLDDPEVKFEAQMKLARLYAETGAADELRDLARSVAGERELSYPEQYQVIEIALEAEAWSLALDLADSSLALANPGSFRSDYPDKTDEECEEGARRRVAFSSALRGWALANLGRHDEALATFTEALPMTSFSILGADETDLHYYWGKTLMRTGDYEGALEKLEVEALYGREEAMEPYRESWRKVHGSDEGLEDHLWAARQEHARPLPAFTLADYEGSEVGTADFAGKVLLVTAWNPG